MFIPNESKMALSTTHSKYIKNLVLQGSEENMKNDEEQCLVSVNLRFERKRHTHASFTNDPKY